MTVDIHGGFSDTTLSYNELGVDDSKTGLRINGIADLGHLSTLTPALSPSVELSLTVIYIVIFGLLFVTVYVQLWMIWYYRHKRFSYQTVFLILCLIWAGLRTTLFSFYFKNCILANELSLFFYWLLYCFPNCLQFITLSLLVLFFAQVVFKARAKYEPNKYKRPLRIAVAVVVIIFLATNIGCAVGVKLHQREFHSLPVIYLNIRVAINESLFVLAGVTLSVCIYKMAKMSSSVLVLEAKGTTMCQAKVVCVFVVAIYLSRALYNMLAILPTLLNKMPGFNFDWVNVSDRTDFFSLWEGFSYLFFGIVLFVWEVLPTLVVVIFFRVHRPSSTMALDMSSQSYNSKAYFFDNPRRYDSDDDLTRPTNQPGSLLINSVVGSPRTNYAPKTSSHYGAVMSASYQSEIGGTPPVLYGTNNNLP